MSGVNGGVRERPLDEVEDRVEASSGGPARPVAAWSTLMLVRKLRPIVGRYERVEPVPLMDGGASGVCTFYRVRTVSGASPRHG